MRANAPESRESSAALEARGDSLLTPELESPTVLRGDAALGASSPLRALGRFGAAHKRTISK